MGRRRTGREKPTGSSHEPVAGLYDTDTGTCELVKDPYRDSGWILEVNGVPSSHIDPDDPTLLEFEYMRWITMLVHSQFSRDTRLRALHLGGGACTMARYLAATYPDARQVVVEIDGRLAELVREWFDLPRAPMLRIRVGEGRAVLTSLTDATRDVIIRDVFAINKTPVALTTLEFTRHVLRVLAPGGLYVVNCGDTRDLTTARREAATIGSVFEHTAMIADPAMLKAGAMAISSSRAATGRSESPTPWPVTCSVVPCPLRSGTLRRRTSSRRVRRFSTTAKRLSGARRHRSGEHVDPSDR